MWGLEIWSDHCLFLRNIQSLFPHEEDSPEVGEMYLFPFEFMSFILFSLIKHVK